MSTARKPPAPPSRPNEGRVIGPEDVGIVDGRLRLMASHCRACDARNFPAYTVCPFCLSEDQAPAPLSDTGTLHSFTFVHIAPAAWEVPYGIAYVDLPEGVRVFGKLADADAARWKLDQPVRIEVVPAPGEDGQAPHYQYFFNAAQNSPEGTP